MAVVSLVPLEKMDKDDEEDQDEDDWGMTLSAITWCNSFYACVLQRLIWRPFRAHRLGGGFPGLNGAKIRALWELRAGTHFDYFHGVARCERRHRLEAYAMLH
jgi:hypothetical protein